MKKITDIHFYIFMISVTLMAIGMMLGFMLAGYSL